jgi:hypothetical protein
LLIESLQKFHHYYGDEFKVECPTGSGQFATLDEIANELSNRLIKLFLRNEKGERPFVRASGDSLGAADRDQYLFHEFFHGDTGAGLGASHQTGWTGLVAKLIQQQGTRRTIAQRELARIYSTDILPVGPPGILPGESICACRYAGTAGGPRAGDGCAKMR